MVEPASHRVDLEFAHVEGGVAVLRITPSAGLTIIRLVDSEGGAGLRLEATDQDFAMSVAPVPDENDLVVIEETTGARVLVDSLTAELVADSTLDVDEVADGTSRFHLGGQGVTNR